MAFHSMKKMAKASKGAYKKIEELVQDGWYVIPNFLKTPQDRTVVRLLPALEEGSNEILDLLNPEGSYEDVDNTLGIAFARVEVFSAWLGAKHSCISTVNADNAGNAVPFGRSPLYTITDRIRYKGYEQGKRLEAGLSIDAPRTWLKWRADNVISTPIEQLFIQCLLLEEQSTVCTDINGNPTIRDNCVMMIPVSAVKGEFIRRLCKPADSTKPLSDSNNKFGDIHSKDKGHTLELHKTTDKKAVYYFETGDIMPLTKEDTAIIKKWTNVIKIPTVEESIQYCYDIFEDPAMIDYGLRNSETWSKYIPEKFRGSSDNISEAGSIQDIVASVATEPVRTRKFAPADVPKSRESKLSFEESVVPPEDVSPARTRRVGIQTPTAPAVGHTIPDNVNQTLRDNIRKIRALNK